MSNNKIRLLANEEEDIKKRMMSIFWMHRIRLNKLRPSMKMLKLTSYQQLRRRKSETRRLQCNQELKRKWLRYI
jgi:hypothetical protein